MSSIRLTVLAIALGVSGLVEHAGHPKTAYAILGAAMWDAFLRDWWSQSGHWLRIGWYRAWVAVFVFAILLLAYAPAGADERLNPTLELTKLKLEVHWVDSHEDIRDKAREFHACPQSHSTVLSDQLAARSCLAGEHDGFAVLGKRGGEQICLVFVLKPTRVNDTKTLTLGHELLHCLLGAYHP